jgi:hypothetical protein
MNVERVKYWLSVGAQPTDHCSRLLAKVINPLYTNLMKAALIPPKPPYQERLKRVSLTAARGSWGTPDQGFSQSRRGAVASIRKIEKGVKSGSQSEELESRKSMEIKFESEVRKKTIDLVSSVFQESFKGETTLRPGSPDIDSTYLTLSHEGLKQVFALSFEGIIREDEQRYNIIKKHFESMDWISSPPTRFFLAYFKPRPLDNETWRYNEARLLFLQESLNIVNVPKSELLEHFDELKSEFLVC